MLKSSNSNSLSLTLSKVLYQRSLTRPGSWFVDSQRDHLYFSHQYSTETHQSIHSFTSIFPLQLICFAIFTPAVMLTLLP